MYVLRHKITTIMLVCKSILNKIANFEVLKTNLDIKYL